MKLTVGSVLAIVTLVATILIGGSNFGELRSATKTNAQTILEYRLNMETQAVNLRSESMENMRIVAKMSADIEWIKDNIRRRNHNDDN